jgi:hypothetical protein
MSNEEAFYLAVDALAILATVIMLNLTEKKMPEPITETDEQRIHAMLDDAQTSGYDISTWTADDIVADLLAFAELKETDTADTLKPHVIKWKTERNYASG